jgi:hypothetical protein
VDLAGALLISPPNMAHEAISYARDGWAIFPTHSPTRRGCSCGRPACDSRGKHPRTTSGLTAATTDLETVEAWWWRWPTANIGAVVPEGHLVVDLDPRHGSAETLTALKLPDTLTVRTGGGGEHRYYTHPGGDLRQGAAVLGPGVDTRMPGRGYVLLPPSLHASGQRYRWTDTSVAVADLPKRVLELLHSAPGSCTSFSPARRTARRGGYGRAALAMEEATVRTAVAGTRNDRLNNASFSLGQLVADGLLELNEVAGTLLAAAVSSGLGEREAMRTIESGLKAGQRYPRGRTA